MTRVRNTDTEVNFHLTNQQATKRNEQFPAKKKRRAAKSTRKPQAQRNPLPSLLLYHSPGTVRSKVQRPAPRKVSASCRANGSADGSAYSRHSCRRTRRRRSKWNNAALRQGESETKMTAGSVQGGMANAKPWPFAKASH